jgi:hypothetical protein
MGAAARTWAAAASLRPMAASVVKEREISHRFSARGASAFRTSSRPHGTEAQSRARRYRREPPDPPTCRPEERRTDVEGPSYAAVPRITPAIVIAGVVIVGDWVKT